MAVEHDRDTRELLRAEQICAALRGWLEPTWTVTAPPHPGGLGQEKPAPVPDPGQFPSQRWAVLWPWALASQEPAHPGQRFASLLSSPRTRPRGTIGPRVPTDPPPVSWL